MDLEEVGGEPFSDEDGFNSSVSQLRLPYTMPHKDDGGGT